MAVNNTTGSFASMEFPMAFSRQDSFPLDKSSVSLSDAQTYAQTSPLAYVGQVIAVVVDGTATIYQIKNTAGDLEALASGDFEGNVEAVLATQIASDTEVTEMLNEVFGTNDAEGCRGLIIHTNDRRI